MRGQENEFDGDEEVFEEQAEQLYNERLEEVEVQIEQDEHPPEPETDQQPERKKLKREMQAEAIIRLEDAARAQDDFQKVVDWWDKWIETGSGGSDTMRSCETAVISPQIMGRQEIGCFSRTI